MGDERIDHLRWQIAAEMECEPEDDADLVEAVRLCVQERDQAVEQNKTLRANVVALVAERQTLEDLIARQSAYLLELKRRFGLAPHDYEPARPGIDVD